MASKTLLNKDNRVLLLNFAKAQIAKTDSEEKQDYIQKRQDYFASFEPCKQVIKDMVAKLYSKDDLKVLAKHGLQEQESCFWLKEDAEAEREAYVSMPPEGCNEGHTSYYRSSKARVAKPEDTTDMLALFHDEMVAEGINITDYLAYENTYGKNAQGKRMTYAENDSIRGKIREFSTKEWYKNVSFDGMSFNVPYSKNSCHQRARLVSTDKIEHFLQNHRFLEVLRISFNTLQKSREKLFEAYKGLIMASKYFETILETWAEASAMSAHVGRKGETALSIVSEDAINLIKQDQLKRKMQDETLVVVSKGNRHVGS
tara:strand:+ start:2350 stop:3294 length:945 start_codon:yes stop_codon:yes gene_type:complete